MKLLILGDQHTLAASLQRQLSLRAEHIDVAVISLQVPALTDALNRQFEEGKPDVLIAALFLPVDSEEALQQHYRQLLLTVRSAAIHYQLPLIFFSSAAVFDGGRLAYHESDAVCPAGDYGKWYVEMERLVAEHSQHMIIRTGWLYGSQGDNFLSATIQYAASDRLISVNSAGKACPTSMDDLARVLLAILLQMEQQAENWGVFHYVASDTALGFQFIEAILAQASQYVSSIDPKQLRFEHNDQPEPAFYFEPVVLKCHRLLEDFGIHQRPWRALLHSVVREYFQLKVK